MGDRALDALLREWREHYELHPGYCACTAELPCPTDTRLTAELERLGVDLESPSQQEDSDA